jgi:heme oxygenase (biliverdin-IX-beta and delta-forming)
VKQGSTLGGSVMSKALRRHLALQPLTDQRFFAGYGDQNGIEWQKFIENLFATTSSLQPTETIETAVACFQGVASICDAVLRLKDADGNTLQTP